MDKTEFLPTDEQIAYAQKYLKESGHDSLFVAVNFPGKQQEIWTEGQIREPVMDGEFPVIWVDRNSAWDSFETGNYGNAMFRVYLDGHSHVVYEA